MNLYLSVCFVKLLNETCITPTTPLVFFAAETSIYAKACSEDVCFDVESQYLLQIEDGVFLLQFALLEHNFQITSLVLRNDAGDEKRYCVFPAALTEELQDSLHAVMTSDRCYLLFPPYFPSDLMLIFEGQATKSVHRNGQQTPLEATTDDYVYISDVSSAAELRILLSNPPYSAVVVALRNSSEQAARAQLYECGDSRCIYVYDYNIVADSAYKTEILTWDGSQWRVAVQSLQQGFYMLLEVGDSISYRIVKVGDAVFYHKNFDPTEILVAAGIILLFSLCYWIYQRVSRRSRALENAVQ